MHAVTAVRANCYMRLSKWLRQGLDYPFAIQRQGAVGLRALLLGLVCCGLSAEAAARSGPTAEEQALWQKEPVPFWVKPTASMAPAGAIEPPKVPSVPRIAWLQRSAEYAAKRYKAIGLRAPHIEIQDGKFRLLFGRKSADGSAAFYAPGFEGSGIAVKGKAFAMAVDDWPRQIFLGETDTFDTAESRIYPERPRATIAHELFHAIQANYPDSTSASSKSTSTKWVGEGLSDALGLWAVTGLDGFDPAKRFKGGQREFGKALGLRPWDMPLELSEFTATPLWYEKTAKSLYGIGDKRTLAAYQTSAFWQFVFAGPRKPEHHWRGLHQMLSNPPSSSGDANRALLRWTDAGIRSYVAAHPNGLSHALSAFIPYLVEYPDQVVESRSGIFRHPDWLSTIFSNGCPRHVISAENTVAPITLDVKRRAAQCVRIAWSGYRYRDSGWPAAIITAVATDGSEAGAKAIHLGVNGQRNGVFSVEPDKDSGRWVKTWGPVAIDPLNPQHTSNEAVLTFINVASSKDPDDTINRSYEIKIGFAAAKAEGSVTQPADPEADPPRPASTGKAAGQRGVNPPVLQPSVERGGIAVNASSAAQSLPAVEDCTNGTLKLMGSVNGMSIERRRQTPVPGTQSQACIEMMQKLQNPASVLGATKGLLDVQLDLPVIPTGMTGAVKGATISVSWADPALRPSGSVDVSAETELVNVNVAQATESFVRGGFSARFTEDLHGVVGTVTGDFLVWRSNAAAPQPPESVLDLFSSDFLLAASYVDMDVKAMEQMAAAARAEQAQEGSGGGGSSGGGGNGGGRATAGSEPSCNCDCNEFLSLRRDACAAQCLNYSHNSAQCVVERNIGLGRSREQLERAIGECPTDCARLSGNVSQLCADALYGTRRACLVAGPGGVTQKQIDCYLDYVVRELDEPQRGQFRNLQADQIAGMEPASRDQFIGALLDGLKSEGLSCPAH